MDLRHEAKLGLPVLLVLHTWAAAVRRRSADGWFTEAAFLDFALEEYRVDAARGQRLLAALVAAGVVVDAAPASPSSGSLGNAGAYQFTTLFSHYLERGSGNKVLARDGGLQPGEGRQNRTWSKDVAWDRAVLVFRAAPEEASERDLESRDFTAEGLMYHAFDCAAPAAADAVPSDATHAVCVVSALLASVAVLAPLAGMGSAADPLEAATPPVFSFAPAAAFCVVRLGAGREAPYFLAVSAAVDVAEEALQRAALDVAAHLRFALGPFGAFVRRVEDQTIGADAPPAGAANGVLKAALSRHLHGAYRELVAPAVVQPPLLPLVPAEVAHNTEAGAARQRANDGSSSSTDDVPSAEGSAIALLDWVANCAARAGVHMLAAEGSDAGAGAVLYTPVCGSPAILASRALSPPELWRVLGFVSVSGCRPATPPHRYPARLPSDGVARNTSFAPRLSGAVWADPVVGGIAVEHAAPLHPVESTEHHMVYAPPEPGLAVAHRGDERPPSDSPEGSSVTADASPGHGSEEEQAAPPQLRPQWCTGCGWWGLVVVRCGTVAAALRVPIDAVHHPVWTHAVWEWFSQQKGAEVLTTLAADDVAEAAHAPRVAVYQSQHQRVLPAPLPVGCALLGACADAHFALEHLATHCAAHPPNRLLVGSGAGAPFLVCRNAPGAEVYYAGAAEGQAWMTQAADEAVEAVRPYACLM
eukprot:TRINITY_DN16003_c0_g1_i1.p1 TRINITY_DN16003_c0_g1~~TRINITY_DN16003_c0_g1_i1.p1  ORF type:complete len:701 (+),score=101.35 TRINITY_DN16003_c0_g1_i1:107-2209(+)